MSLAAAVFTGLLLSSRDGARSFAPYFRTLHPLLAIAMTTALGFLSLGFLVSRGWFQIRSAKLFRGVGFAAALATIFGIWQVGADLLVTRFPKDINVPAPQSLLFYPAIGYVVEVLFHLLPLAGLLFIVDSLGNRRPNATVIWLCIVCVSALEPVLVHMRMGASTYVGVFVFVFTLVELDIFRRYDFVSMYAFRLVFYLWWHVIWGYWRLRWLF